MANVMKFTRSGTGAMFRHFERYRREDGSYLKFGNQEIDTSRTHLNYVLKIGNEDPQRRFERRLGEVKCFKRSDVKVMAAWVFTLPKDCPVGLERKFFEACMKFMRQTYGVENIVAGYVHKDETTPHMHVPFVPVTADKKKQEKVCAKDLLTRKHLEQFHPKLQKFVDRELGRHVSILIDDEVKRDRTIDELKKHTAEAHAELDDMKRAARDAEEELEAFKKDQEARRIEFENLEQKYESEVEEAEEMANRARERADEVLYKAKNERDRADRIEFQFEYGKGLLDAMQGIEGDEEFAERIAESFKTISDLVMLNQSSEWAGTKIDEIWSSNPHTQNKEYGNFLWTDEEQGILFRVWSGVREIVTYLVAVTMDFFKDVRAVIGSKFPIILEGLGQNEHALMAVTVDTGNRNRATVIDAIEDTIGKSLSELADEGYALNEWRSSSLSL